MLRKSLSLLLIMSLVASYVLNDLAFVYAEEAQDKKLVLAVLDYLNSANDPDLEYLVRGIPESIITNLGRSGKLNIVERSRMEQALSELQLGLTGAIDDRTAVEIGRAVGANVVMTGSFLKIGKVIELNTRLIDVKTLRLIGSEQVRGAPGEEIFGLIDESAQGIEQKLLGKYEVEYDRIPSSKLKKETKKSIFTRWWFWGIIAAGAAGGVYAWQATQAEETTGAIIIDVSLPQ